MNPADFRAARDALGLTQRELAVLIGRNKNTIARYEAGDLDVPQVVALAVRGLLAEKENER